MVQRVKTSVVALVPFILWLGFSHTVLMNIGICIFATICIYELFRAAGYLKEIPELAWAGMVFGAVIPFNEFLPYKVHRVIIVAFVFYAFLMMILHHERIKMNNLSAVLAFSWLIPTALSCIIWIRRMESGSHLIALVFAITWVTDSFAYIFGSNFGTKKLCPSISPNKTVEGAVFGAFGGIAAILVFDVVMRTFYGHQLTNVLPFMIGAIVCSLAAQAGDLSASALKREFSLKDFGNIFPGHGGMLDRFDSILFVAPVLYLFLQTIEVLI